MTLNRTTILMAEYAERYGLSLVFGGLAIRELKLIWGIWAGQAGPKTTVFILLAHHLSLFLLGLFTGLLLLLGRRAVVPPQKLKFILVPLVATFFTVFYYVVPWFPARLQVNLCPPEFQKILVIAGLTFIIIGPLFALWGILHLGRSFGVFVTVRKVVMTGPYQWIRHPMYLSGVCLCLGVALANCSIAYFLLVAVHISLLLYRARLEETQLAEHSREYLAYMNRTGFIFPRFRNSQVMG